MRGSFRTRLILVNTAVVAGLLAVLGWVSVESSRRTALRLVDQDLQVRARNIARGPLPLGPNGSLIPPEPPPGPGRPDERFQPGAGPGEPGGPAGFQPPPGEESGGRADRLRGPQGGPFGLGRRFGDPVNGPVVVNLAGQVAAPQGRQSPWSSRLAALGGRKPAFDFEDQDGRRLRVISSPVVRDGQVMGHIQAAQDMEGVELALQGQVQALLLLFPAGAALSALAGWLLARSALGPVGRATEAARAIAGSGDLSQRLPVAGADEMSRLGDAFNQMLDKIGATMDQRDEANAQLARSLEDQKRFTADASHELRTPLTRIILAADNGLASQDSGQESLKAIRGAAKGMSVLVEQLLLLAKADSGRLPLAMAQLDLRLPAAEALVVSGLADDARLSVDLGDEPLMAWADSDSVRRILINLLDNASRFTPADGQIRLCRVQDGSRVALLVADNGPGLPPEALERLGERFFRPDAARAEDKGGHGLGLSICRSLAVAMGGDLSFVSGPGLGLHARLILWASPPASPSSQIPHSESAK